MRIACTFQAVLNILTVVITYQIKRFHNNHRADSRFIMSVLSAESSSTPGTSEIHVQSLSAMTRTHFMSFMFPNLFSSFHLLVLISLTSAAVEHAKYALTLVETVMLSTRHQDRRNALVLLHVHKDIKLDIQAVIDTHKWKHPRRMLFINALSGH